MMEMIFSVISRMPSVIIVTSRRRRHSRHHRPNYELGNHFVCKKTPNMNMNRISSCEMMRMEYKTCDRYSELRIMRCAVRSIHGIWLRSMRCHKNVIHIHATATAIRFKSAFYFSPSPVSSLSMLIFSLLFIFLIRIFVCEYYFVSIFHHLPCADEIGAVRMFQWEKHQMSLRLYEWTQVVAMMTACRTRARATPRVLVGKQRAESLYYAGIIY